MTEAGLLLGGVLRAHGAEPTPVAWILTGVIVAIVLLRALYRRSRRDR
jgi:hypothetical protein